MKMNYEELKTANATPAAASMVETFRAMGYSLETAMADILDNSISAGANNISGSRESGKVVNQLSLLKMMALE